MSALLIPPRWWPLLALFATACGDERCRLPLGAAPDCELGCPNRDELLASLEDADCDETALGSCTNAKGETYEIVTDGELRWFLQDETVVAIEDRAAQEVCAEVGSRWYGKAVLNCASDDLPGPIPGCED